MAAIYGFRRVERRNDVNSSEKTHKKRRKLMVFGIIILLLLVNVFPFVVFRILLKWKLNTRIKAIRAANYPVTCKELDAWYSIPDDVENAADTFFDAFACFEKWDETRCESLPLVGLADLPKRTEPLSDDTRTLLTEYVNDHNETIALLHTAVKIEHCRYPFDFAAGFGGECPHFADLRWACFLLNLESFLHVENDEEEAARRSVLSGFGLTLSLTKEPSLISQLVRMGLTSRNISTLEHLINRIELTDEQLGELFQCLDKVEREADLSCAIVGERCTVLSYYTAPSFDPAPFDIVLPRSSCILYKTVGLVDLNAIVYLDLMSDYMEAIRLPYPQCLEVSDAINAKIESMSNIHMLVREMMSALSRVITIETITIAHLRTARVGLAVLRYRLVSGTLPDSLKELVPAYIDAVPVDPFDGNALRYKKRGTGFVIYSIGEDFSDDGGTEKPKYEERKKHPNWDVTFIVER